MVNKGTYQVLQALMLFGAGDLWYRPSYKGYALGDSKLTTIRAQRLVCSSAKGLKQQTPRRMHHLLSAELRNTTRGKYIWDQKVTSLFTPTSLLTAQGTR